MVIVIMRKFNKTVDEVSGFNFIVNPFEVNTHICESGLGIYVCISPKDGERYKYQPCRRATKKEFAHYMQWKEKQKITGYESHLSWDNWDQW